MRFRNSLAFLGYFHVRVYDYVFVCLFRPRLAWHRGLTKTLEQKRPWTKEKTSKLYNALSQKNFKGKRSFKKTSEIGKMIVKSSLF